MGENREGQYLLPFTSIFRIILLPDYIVNAESQSQTTTRSTEEDGMNTNTWRPTDASFSEQETEFTPRTALGGRLYALRRQAIASGMKLLSQDEVLAEVKRHRGEAEDHETDLH